MIHHVLISIKEINLEEELIQALTPTIAIDLDLRHRIMIVIPIMMLQTVNNNEIQMDGNTSIPLIPIKN